MIKPSSISEIRSISIEKVAQDLKIIVKRHTCRCPFHDDKHPSMQLYESTQTAHCFVCDKSWNAIGMVMQLKRKNFQQACIWIADNNQITLEYDTPHYVTRLSNMHRTPKTAKLMTQTTSPTPTTPMVLPDEYVSRKLSSDNSFCRSLVANGILTPTQMQSAVHRYLLGSSRNDGVIFWQIDELRRVRDGKIMHYGDDCHRDRNRSPNWVCSMLAKAGKLNLQQASSKCMFGLHLLNMNGNEEAVVAIVESEKTAVICSELIPQLPCGESSVPVIWMATGGLGCLNASVLVPLAGRKVILFPDTDPEGNAYKLWAEKAQEASSSLGQPFTVSQLLEQNASAQQKEQKIDIADYLLEER